MIAVQTSPSGTCRATRTGNVVALTSHNDVATIGAAARALRDGLTRYFGSSVARFVLADAGSTDGTRDAVREALGRRLGSRGRGDPWPNGEGGRKGGAPARGAAARAEREPARA